MVKSHVHVWAKKMVLLHEDILEIVRLLVVVEKPVLELDKKR